MNHFSFTVPFEDANYDDIEEQALKEARTRYGQDITGDDVEYYNCQVVVLVAVRGTN